MTTQEWDVALTPQGKRDGRLQVVIPRVLANALVGAGYNRAKLRLTDEGILLVPYAGEREVENAPTITLPDWAANSQPSEDS